MIRFLFFLLLEMFISQGMFAQDSHPKKITNTDSSYSTIGFKKQSQYSQAGEKKTTLKNPNHLPVNNRNTDAVQYPIKTLEADDASKASEIISIDFKNMPADVQLKISNNKARGKNVLEGIAKVFSVEIKTCITDADHKKTLQFLKSKKGFLNSEFVSTGLVKIIVEPTFDAADLKDAMNATGISFNFLNRSYLLKK